MKQKDVPHISTTQMRKIDKLMQEKYEMSMPAMMESAGKHLAQVAADMMDDEAEDHVLVCVGSGNNGGSGLVAARYLAQKNFHVHVLLAHRHDRLKRVAKMQLGMLQHFGNVKVHEWIGLEKKKRAKLFAHADIIVDALLGYSASGKLKEPMKAIVEHINHAGKETSVLSLDLPSGLHAKTGAREKIVNADATLTLALPKKALKKRMKAVGELYLADIGVLPALYEELKLDVPKLFSKKPIVHLTHS